MPSRVPPLAALAAALLAVAVLSACAPDPWQQPRVDAGAVGAPGEGFHPDDAPAPEATVDPVAGSWEGVRPAPGYRVVLLTAGDDAPTATLTDAVASWAEKEQVTLRTVRADDDALGGIVEAMELQPNLIISAGAPLIDPLALVSASHLDVPFLVLGAELPEPTSNVTAVEWNGAGYRGEGLVTSTEYDPATFTPERSASAVHAGVTAVLTGLTGVVIWID
ncbi:hypothetical protein LQ938_08135 [Microbacterium sp. cx-55]|uniref:hypothetical protein n=1 Tax=unclassified Microbacterium TaxID=2609290 RepID=UPI001CBAAEAE|nr:MULTISPECIES: hypothetical protein [unclassified Microbacterium]MBZ4486290.1 hypothetical protein [Microbacterium sp. cx-55]MCC4907255.1 hypothetical protein [Microbacterium sp. cx-59]UGB33870.1 hypothetical protein LQ938_08135 [Microbacterium sp. cx-55]